MSRITIIIDEQELRQFSKFCMWINIVLGLPILLLLGWIVWEGMR